MQRRKVLTLAPEIAAWFLDDDLTFAGNYRDLVRVFRDAKNYEIDLGPQYLAVLRDGETAHHLLPSDRFAIANEHDVANLHHAVWLLMLYALARLLNYNLHGDWGDPPAGGTSQGRYDDYDPKPDNFLSFHTTPNLYGSYAISTLDLSAPDLGIGEAPRYPPKSPSVKKADDPPLNTAEIRDIARRLGRALVDGEPHDGPGQHPYHRVVKRFYSDRGSHTAEYADVIGALLYPTDQDPGNDERAAQLAGRISDDDFANIHRGAWLFLAHRFSYLVGWNPFGSFGSVANPVQSVDLPSAEGGPRVLEVPNRDGAFSVNLEDIDPDEDY